MKIALVVNRTFNELEKLREVARERGHEIDIVILEMVNISDPGHDSMIRSLLSYDLVHHRAALGIVLAKFIESFLKEHGVLFLGSSTPLSILKSHQIIMASLAGIKTPKTLIAGSRFCYDDAVKELGNTFIIKAISGAGGKEVMLVSSEEEFKSAIKIIHFPILQELVPNDGDYRIHTFNGKAVAVYKRVPQSGEFRANVKQGGTMEAVNDAALIKRLYEMAEQASRVMGITVAGIDIIQSTKTGELYFIESNGNPGWKDVKKITGVDLADHTIDYYEDFYQKHASDTVR